MCTKDVMGGYITVNYVYVFIYIESSSVALPHFYDLVPSVRTGTRTLNFCILFFSLLLDFIIFNVLILITHIEYLTNTNLHLPLLHEKQFLDQQTDQWNIF